MRDKRIVYIFKFILMTMMLSVAILLILFARACDNVVANTYQGSTGRVINVDLVVLTQTIKNNRLGAEISNGQIYVLAHDVTNMNHPVDHNGLDTNSAVDDLNPGDVRLKTYKRPRPITLRANVGDKLVIRLRNLLEKNTTVKTKFSKKLETAGLQIMGLDWATDDKGKPADNAKRIKIGESHTYYYLAEAEGVFMLYSPNGQFFPNSQSDYGLFGAVNVQPAEAEWYRSQVTADDLTLATYKVSEKFMNTIWTSDNTDICFKKFGAIDTGLAKGIRLQRKMVYKNNQLVCPASGATTLWELSLPKQRFEKTPKVSQIVITDKGILNTQAGQPVINYDARYPKNHIRSGLPVLNMLANQTDEKSYQLVHSDLTAIITGPDAGRFPYYLDSPSFIENPASPDRRQPYREFTINYHISPNTSQAFDAFKQGPLVNTLNAGQDGFAVNYGIAGIGPEIYANRINVGPMGINGDGVDLLFEEFFLSAWAVGDPAILVDNPANVNGRATKALYPDDPSNVYHSYMRDHVKFRILNAGSVAPHVHHQHAHQWLHTPNSDKGHYLDSQMVNPGSTYTLEMTYNGSGNRNQTVGDSIFHCHIYPHFAQGMWALWRVHDVFEEGTVLNNAGIPNPGARALPDGEIIMGTPIPGLVPLPSIAMAPMPAKIKLIENGRRVEVQAVSTDSNGDSVYTNPGFPFFVPGIAGHRAPHPPLDFAWKEDKDRNPIFLSKQQAANNPFREAGDRDYLDGGLPRHVVLGGEVLSEFHSRWDFSKSLSSMLAMELPEDGTPIEQAAMAAHATRSHDSFLPDGLPGNFILNGLPPVPGAPYAAPEVDDQGNSTFNERRYKAAVIQTDVVFNKQGWHYPQQRFITLLEDVKATVHGKKAPEPFFFRANTDETIEFWHTNLVPNYYQLDDFQVRTPTDILGQHIHLVKFDVTSSDGAGNGFNYEDGTFSPDEVRDRIKHINTTGGLYHYNPNASFNTSEQSKLTVSSYVKDYGGSLGRPPAGQDWNGTQTTIQRFDTDPLLNNQGEDRTLRTVFTHDHYGPSTHQQAGLYGALLVEPAGSTWRDAISGAPMPSEKRSDGGPTSWQAIIETHDSLESYREFALAMGDMQLAYNNKSPTHVKQVKNVFFTINGDITDIINVISISDITTDIEVTTKTDVTTNTDISKTTDIMDIQDNKVIKAIKKGLDDQQVIQTLSEKFSAQGVILGDNVKVSVKEIANKWTITRNQTDVFTLKYRADKNTIDVWVDTIVAGWADTVNAIYPPASYAHFKAPYPTIISDPGGSGNIGTWVVNYRSEPLDARVQAPLSGANKVPGIDSKKAVDPAFAYSSIKRNNAALNTQPNLYKTPLVPIGIDGVQATDPYTPLLRAYENDKIQVRVVVGAVDSIHSMRIQGVNWSAEPSYPNSGRRDVQGMGISEHFEMLFQLPTAGLSNSVDHLYSLSASNMGGVKGAWGIMRAYKDKVENLAMLSNNHVTGQNKPIKSNYFYAIPKDAKVRKFTLIQEVSKKSSGVCRIQYSVKGSCLITKPTFKCSTFKPPVPLILRAQAGEWIQLSLKNCVSEEQAKQFTTKFTALNRSSMTSSENTQPYKMSAQAGLTPLLVAYDSATNSGFNIGINAKQTVSPNETREFVWYAGDISVDEHGTRTLTAMEFGGVNLLPADPLLQQSYGLFGALIIEPVNSHWDSSDDHSLSAKIKTSEGKLLFTEIVVIGNNAASTSAQAGTEVRLRVLNPNNSSNGLVNDNVNMITIEGHGWPEEPFIEGSRVMADNSVSQWMGTQQVTPLESYNLLLPSAGGVDKVPGSYDFYYYSSGPTGKLGTLTVTP